MAESKCTKNHSENNELTLVHLSPDILSKIIVFSSPKTVVRLSKTCKQLYAICNTDLQWKYLFELHYLDSSLPPEVSHKHFLQNHYYHLYPLIGLWVVTLPPYNIVLKISQSRHDPCLLVGWMPALGRTDHNSFSQPILCKHQVACFAVSDHLRKYFDEKKLIYHFSGTFEGGDKLNPLYSFHLNKSSLSEEVLSCLIDTNAILSLRSQDTYAKKRSEILNSNYESPLHALEVNRISIKRVASEEPQLLSPGVYKGDYSVHGLELLLVYYQEGEILAVKLAGDGNIPGGKISLKCIHTNKLQCGTDPAILDPTDGGKRYYQMSSSIYPKSFTALYPGQGQIAYDGYFSPTFCSGMMYVADEKTFIFSWGAPLTFCSLYMRCDELSEDCKFI